MPSCKYKHLFFDLDRTLWDFDKNSIETFHDIHHKYELSDRGVVNFDKFLDTYLRINTQLWEVYRKGGIEKEVLSVERFSLTLNSFGIVDDVLSRHMALDYIHLSPTKKNLFPGTFEVLEYLHSKYALHIITNGFEEVQHKKVAISGLGKFFNHTITSDEAGYKKPDYRIFKYSLDLTGAKSDESLMIGDDPEIDIIGAKAVGIDQVLIDHEGILDRGEATYYVRSLFELASLL